MTEEREGDLELRIIDCGDDKRIRLELTHAGKTSHAQVTFTSPVTEGVARLLDRNNFV